MFRTPVERAAKGRSRQYRVGVAGACRGCGASFIAGTAAFFLSEKGVCTLAELGTPYFYHALDVPRRFPSGFLFYEDLSRDRKSLLSVRNMYGQLDLLLRRPDAEGLAPPMTACRLPGEAAVFDLSGADDAYLDEVLPEMDEVLLVADPLPGRLLAGEERLRRVIMEYPHARIVVNKMNGGVHRSELRRFLGAASTLEVPFIDPALIYRAEYSCVLPAELPAVRRTVENLFT